MTQRLRDTDACILMEFDRAVQHLKDAPVTQKLQKELATLAKPYLERLKANGHGWVDALSLLRAVFMGD